MLRRRKLDEEWVRTILFAKLPEEIDDGLTTTLYRYAQVAGMPLAEARALAAAKGSSGWFLKFWTDERGRELVRMNREHRERFGLLSALGLGSLVSPPVVR
ncbi:MAG: hypothetical protein ACKVU1_00660 [bacterium]